MTSRFEDRPDETQLVTPEIAERIVERFAEKQAERQKVEAAERERLANMTRVQELADLLGTTSEEIESIAKEITGPYIKAPSPMEPITHVPEPAKPTWPIHLAYLCALSVAVMWALSKPAAFGPSSSTPYLPASAFPGRSTVTGIQFDPYLGGYMRSMDVMMMGAGQIPTQLVTAPQVNNPPSGFQVNLITPLGRKIVQGVLGGPVDSKAAALELQKSIRSLLAYEESLAKVTPTLPVVSYDKAPIIANSQYFDGRPTLVGWHSVEVFSYGQTYKALLPDHRYAKDEAAYQKAMQVRLDNITDTKFFPTLPPANLRPGAIEIHPTPALPSGTSIMIYNSAKTIWARGTNKSTDYEVVKESLQEAFREAASKLRPLMGNEKDLAVWFNYPGGEYYSGTWPFVHRGATEPQAEQMRKTQIAEMIAAFRKSLTGPHYAPSIIINQQVPGPSSRP